MPGTPSIAIFQWPCVAILENARTLYLLHNASVFSLVTSKREKQQAYPLITVVYDSPPHLGHNYTTRYCLSL